MITKPPKILPWLAKKASIGEARATSLWRVACRYATHRAAPNTSPFFALALNRLLELIAAESLREDATSMGWRPWVRAQNRLWNASLEALEKSSVTANRSWRLFNALV